MGVNTKILMSCFRPATNTFSSTELIPAMRLVPGFMTESKVAGLGTALPRAPRRLVCPGELWGVMYEEMKDVRERLSALTQTVHSVLLLGKGTGDSTRLLLWGKTCLGMANTAYYVCSLQTGHVGLLDAGLSTVRCCTGTASILKCCSWDQQGVWG